VKTDFPLGLPVATFHATSPQWCCIHIMS
jgi:hypothetical protein